MSFVMFYKYIAIIFEVPDKSNTPWLSMETLLCQGYAISP